MFGLLKSVVSIDVFDVNWDISSKEINQLELTSSGKYGVLEGLSRLTYHIFKSIIYFKFYTSDFNEKVIRISGTRNQSNALTRLSELGVLIEFGNISDKRENNSFEAIPYLISLFFFPVVVFKYFFEKDRFKRNVLLCRLDRVLFSYGLYLFYNFVLNKNKNDLIIVSNDHSVWQRTLLLVAREKGIRVSYIQHANVSSVFPVLSFDYAFLDGAYAKKMYKSARHCQVIKVGCLRFENYKSLAVLSDGRPFNGGVLVCFNRIDEEEIITNTLSRLSGLLHPDQKLGVRFHPADNRKKLINTLGSIFSFTNETDSNLDDVLLDYSYCLAGVSSIFLEASLAKLYCFSVQEIFIDYYGFQRDGIVKVFSSWDDVDLSVLKSSNEISSFLYNSCEDYLEGISLPSERIKYILKEISVVCE